MYASIDQTNSNKRVFIACLLAFTIMVTPIAALALPGGARADAKPPAEGKSEAQPPATPQLPKAVPAPLFVPGPAALAPSLSATLTDNFALASKKNPGDQIDYTATIANAGVTSPADDALAVIYNATLDANTTLVAGSIHASPIAYNDSYNWVGNTTLDTSARSLNPVTLNDVALTDSITLVTQTNAPTTQGGLVTLSSNGHFVYTPQLGDGGPGFSDTFTYTIQNSVDNTLVGTGTVTINMPVRVWYLQAGAAGDGRSLTPSGNTATISTSADQATDILYVYFNASNLNGPITLDASQTLLGEGVALVANSITLRPAGSAPTITNTTGNAVTLGGTNLVTGLSITQANNFAIAGNAIGGTTNITGVPITNNTTGGGLSLTTQAGTFNMTNSPISGTTSGTAVLVSGGTGAINFSNSPVSRTTGRLIDIQSKTGGSVLFNGGSTVTGTSITTDAIVLLNHTGGTTFTFSNNVNLTTTSGRGIRADNSSGSFSLTMNAAANTISATGGAALDVEDVTANMTFTSTSSTNSSVAPAHGLRVSTTTGSLSFGTTAVSGSANTGVLLASNTSTLTFGDLDITPAAGQRGLHATSNTGMITTTSGSITTTTGTGVEITGGSTTPLAMVLTLVSVNGAPSGIVIQNNSGSLSVNGDNSGARNGTGGVMTNTTDDAIRLTNGNNITLKSINLNSPGDTTHPNLADNEGTLGEHGIEANGGSNVIASGMLIDGPSGSGMIALNLTGTNRLNLNSLVTNVDNPATHGLYIENTTASLTLFEVNNTDFTSSNSGASTVFYRNGGTANMNVDIINTCLFEGLNGQAITATSAISAGTTGTLTSNIKNNTFQNAQGTSENNVGVLVSNDGTHIATVEGNLFDNVAEDGTVANTSVIRTQNTGGKMTAVIKNNTVQNIAYTVGGRHVIGHVFEPAAFNAAYFSNIRIEGNSATNITYTATNREFIFIDYRQFSSGGDIKILGNNWNMPTSASTSEAIDLNFRSSNASTVDLQVDNNGQGTGAISNTGTRFLRIDVEEATTGNVTVTNNKFTNTNGAPGIAIDISTNDDGPTPGGPPTVCANVSGNNVTAAGNTIRLNEAFGTMNVTQASSAAVSTANTAAVVTVVGTPTFGAPACQLPSNLKFDPNETSFAGRAFERPTKQQTAAPVDNAQRRSQAALNLSGPANVEREARGVRNALLLAKATVTGYRSPLKDSINPTAADRQQMRFAHARSSKPRAAVVNTNSFVAPMAGETVNLGGVAGFTLPAGKTVTIKYSATISTAPTAASVSTKGIITPGPGGNFSSFETNDPETGASPPNDPTVTNLNMPDLSILKSHSGTWKQGDTGKTYTITVTNSGTFASFAGSTVSVSDTVPSGLTATAISGTNWTCTQPAGPCTRTDSLAAGGSYEPITLTVNVDTNAPALVTNTAVIANGGGGEVNNANNSDDDPTTIVQAPDLTIDKAHVGNFFQGQTGAQYTITVGNSGPGPVLSGDTVTVTDTLPVSGFTATGISGTGWVCTAPSGPCTRTGANTALPAGNSYPVITLTGNVANNAPTGAAAITNSASVSGGGEINTANNSDSDPTTVNVGTDLTILKSHTGTWTQGDVGKTYTIAVSNVGGTASSGMVTVTDVVPTGLTPTAPIGAHNGWTCGIVSQTLTCTRNDVLAAAAAYPNITLTVNVSNTAPASVTNTATVSGGGDVNGTNNSSDDLTNINALCSTPPPNMTNWWTGDDTARDIAGGKDGTLNGDDGPADLEYSAGKVLNGFDFDGVNDLVNVGDVDLPSTFTIDAWVNPTNLSIDRAIVSKDDGAAQRSYFFHITSAGALQASVNSAGGFTVYQTADGVVTAGSLQHVAVTYDGAAGAGAKMLFYKNGALVASTVQGAQDAGGTPENNSLAALIGRSATTNNTFLGVIDEVEFFSRVLSGAELTTIFTADSGGKCKPSDLKITKTHTDPFVQGSSGNTYTITVHNDGPATTTGTVTVTDILPTGLTPTAPIGAHNGWTCGIASQTLTCTRSDALASGADYPTITLTVTAGVNTPSVINTATVSGGGEMDTSDDTATDPTNLSPSADLEITSKTDAPDPVTASQNITYTINFQNNGPSDAQTVTVTDAVPAGTTFVSATFPAGWGRTDSVPVGGTGNVVFAKATVANAETATFTMVVQVNANAVEGSTITNTATAAGAVSDPTPGNNSKTATTTVNQSDIEITSKTDLPDPVDAGNNITYTVNFKNNSAVNTASNVTVTDAVPTGTTLVSATTVSPGWARTDVVPGGGTGNIVFSKALVAAAETAVFTIVVKVDTNVANGTVITNTATAATTSLDTVSANNSASTTTTVQVNADLEITSKTDAPDPVTASQNITYTINFQNNGPSDAQTVTVTDAVPAGTTFVSASFPAGWGRTDSVPVGGTGNVVFAKATVANAETATFTMVVQVNANAVEGSTITNTATAAGAVSDPTPGNNSKTATTTVNQSDIEITSKTDLPDPVDAGNNITYTVNFKNNSAVNTASNVTVTDAVPTGTTLVSATTVSPGWARTDVVPGGGTGNIVFSKALVAAAETAVFTIVVKVDTNVANGTVITNTATAATTSLDTVSANNSASTTTTVQVNADLEITSKTDAPDPVTASQNITYTINFQNNGPSDAQTVTVTDAVPAGTTFVSASFPAGWGRTDSVPVGGTGNVVFAKATVANAETATFTMVVQVNANAVEGSTITNTATAAGAVSDPTPGNNSKTATTTVNQSDIEITSKTDLPDPVDAGNNITYTVNFKNNSAVNTASNVTVTDAVPTGTTLVSATTVSPGWARTDVVPGGGTGNIVFSKALVAAAETAVFTIVVKVDTNVANGTVITNTATAATTSLDTVSANNSASTTTTVQVNADLEITSKTDAPDPVTASQNITYTINFQNNGPSDAQTVTVTDAVPAGTTFVSASFPAGWSRSDAVAVGGTGNVVFAKATVANAETATFTMVVQVNANAVEGSTITNTATAAGAVSDPTPGNNSKTATTTVNQSDIEITSKTDLPDPVDAGNNITYTVNFKNNSAVNTASNVTVTDAVPTGTTLVSATTVSPGWARTDVVPGGGTGNIVFSKALVAVSETAVFTIVVKVNANIPSGTVITNTATAATTSIDTNSANNSASATTTTAASADLEITSKTDAPDPVTAGDNITYTINFINNGPSDAQTVTVTDAVPANTTFVSAAIATGTGWGITDPGAGNTGNVVFSKGTVAALETASFTVVVKVNASTPAATVIGNSAVAASATTDGTPGNNTGTASTVVATSADLLVTKIDSPDPVTVGSNLTYTITVTNNGFSDAQTLSLSDTLPASTTFVSFAVPGGWTRTDVVPVGGTGTVTATAPTLAAGASAVFTLVVNVNLSTPHNTVLTNSATVTTVTTDPNPVNNTGTTTTTVTSTLALTVNDSGDAADNNVGDRICDTSAAPGDQCTLRAAIQETNAAVTNDTIDFSLPANTTITLLNALETINGGDLVMTGPASGVTVSGNNLNRVFSVGTGNVRILNLTIANGQASQGGGIFNSTNLTIINSTLKGNKAVGSDGGAIYSNSGTLTIINSTISGNTSDGVGGGLANAGTSTATLVNVTITNNRADADGNAAGNGGGISQVSSNPVTLRNTIVAGNFVGLSPGITPDDIKGTVLAASNNNLIGTGGSGGLTNGVNNNQVGVVDARLGVLANNGGPTQTHALLSGSVALDAGDDSVTGAPYNLTTDQRGPGFPRQADGPDANTTDTVDIGAFEADPSVEDISDKSTNEDTALPSFIFNVGDSSAAFTSIVGTSSNTTLVPNANIVVGPDTASTRTLSITPAPNQFGTATITVTVTRGTQSMSDTFILTVNGINDPPSFTKGPDQTVAEDSSPSIPGWATSISPGPSNESGQTLTFLIQNNTNPGLFSAGPAISSTGTLSFTPVANAFGTATITIALMDNGGGTDTSPSQQFVITVFEVNDAPTAVNDSLSSVAEDSPTRTIPIASLLANDSRGPANESGQTLTFALVGGSAVGGTITSDATNVYFTPAADFNGLASFQYTVTDNGTTNGAAAPLTSAPGTVSFTINEINEAPVAVNDMLPDIPDIAEDQGPRSIPFSDLTQNDLKGAANESGQTLTVVSVSSPVGGTVAIVPGYVVFTPFADYNGPVSFKYAVQDNGTTNGVPDPKTSGEATVSFKIAEINDPPTAVNDTLTAVAEDSGERTILFADLTGNDLKGPANESGQTLIVKTVSNPVGGTVSIVGGTVRFTPTANFNGAASFQYTVEDNGTSNNGFADPRTSGPATVSFNITAQADAPSVTNATTNANTQTTSGLVISRNPADGAEVSHFKITGITGGSLFKNDGVTPINNGDFITFAEGNAGLRFTPGMSNGSFTVQASTSASDAGLQGGTATATITVNPLGGVIRFTSGTYNVLEGAGFATITVERTGDTSQAVTVDYASSDHSNPPDFIPCTSPGAGVASSRCDFTTALGTLKFAAGETSKSFNVLISNDNYVEGPETLELTLSNPTGGAVFGVPQTALLTITDDAVEPATNPIDTSIEFVRAQYHDVLNREPDAPGLAFWTDNIEKCNDPARRPAGQTVAQCIDKQRESTAVAFFMSPEFQITGGYVYHLYKGSLTGAPNYDGGSPGRFPTALEFMRDVRQVSEGIVVGNQISGAVVEANRNRLAEEFVQRPEFVAKYGALNNTLYVDELFNTTGIAANAGQKEALVDGLTGGTETRASVLRKVVDGTVVISESNVQFTTTYGQAFINQENSRLFVFMEYIGYLRRNPDAAGFVFWLGKLNTYGGDPFQAEMVRSFILSPEYRSRFGQP